MPLKMQTVSGRYNGLDKKIAFIRSCYAKTLADPRLRRFAENAAGAGDRTKQAINLYNAIRKHLNYLPDPIGVEMTKSPSVMVGEMEARGNSAGDCDDHACFGYTLLKTIGIPAMLRVAWYGNVDMPRHIYVVANLGGRWLPFDTTRKAGFGTEAPYSKKEDF